MRIRARRSLCAAITVAAIAISGCASSSSASNTSGTSGGTSSSNEVTAMMITDVTDPGGTSLQYPINESMGEATADWINANGGINGKKLNLIICDSQTDPNQTAACAREAVADHVVAVVGTYAANGAQIPPILQAAGIPYMPSYPVAPAEFTSPISFPTTSTPFILTGMGYIAGKECQHPTLLSYQQPSTDFNDESINAGVVSQGKKLLQTIVVPSNTTDYAPIAAQAIKGADCLIIYGTATMSGGLLPALQQAGATQRIIGFNSQTLGYPIDSISPNLTNNGIVVGIFPPYTDPVWNDYKAAAAKYGDPKKYDYQEFAAELVYASIVVFGKVADSIPSGTAITSASVLAQLKKSTSVSTDGLFPPFNFTQRLPVSGFSQMFDRSVTFSLVKNGGTVPLHGYTGFVNVGSIFIKAQQASQL
jgi:ABC-type branched-subunit amino acid transport system substrate-binding protein